MTFSTWKLFGIDVIAPRHAQIAEDELRKERQVEADEDQDGREAGPAFGIHAAGHLRPPEVNAAQIRHHRAADHDVVEVGDDEVGVVHVHVDRERRQEQARQPADREQADEAEGVQHRRVRT